MIKMMTALQQQGGSSSDEASTDDELGKRAKAAQKLPMSWEQHKRIRTLMKQVLTQPQQSNISNGSERTRNDANREIQALSASSNDTPM